MLWVEKSTRTAPGAMPSARNVATASRTPSTNGCTNPGWSKNCRTLSIVTVPARPVSDSTRAKSSRYWRQLENDEYALVARASRFVRPAAAAS
jgi:hypothetical protein